MRYDYDVRSCTVAELLRGDSPPFVVPEFQRPYSWTPTDIEALFEDVLDSQPSSDARLTRYFLGAIVLVPRDGTLLVIDGQQRLATISLIIAALIEQMRRLGQTEDAEVLAQGLATKQLGQERRPRLELQPDDTSAYRAAIEGPSGIDEKKRGQHKIYRAALAIRQEIIARTARSEEDTKSLIARMARRFFSDIELVRIDAPNESSAYRLFEALNDRGRALTAADLIKNKIFSSASADLPSVRESWAELQRLIEDNIIGYLRAFWIAFHGPVRRSDLYDVYAQEVDQAPERAVRLAYQLRSVAAIYAGIIAPKRIEKGTVLDKIADHLVRLEQLRAKSGRPLILAFAERWPSKLAAVAGMIETASIRHALACQRNPNQLDAAYNNICYLLRASDSLSADSAVEIVSDGLNRWMPTDEEFGEALFSLRVRSNSLAWRLVLVAIEESLGTGENRVAGPNDVHIEHVLPQVPSDSCLKEAGIKHEQSADLIYRLGNLTLLSGKKNIAASNSAFSAKKRHLLTSRIMLNAEIASNSKWGTAEIDARTKFLSEAACVVWPWPPVVKYEKVVRAKKPASSTSRHEPGQLKLDVAGTEPPGPNRLDPALTLRGTVWIPRLLWALEAAARHDLGDITPSEIARLLESELGTTVQATNTARAFRELKLNEPASGTWWSSRDGRYAITGVGKAILLDLLNERRPSRPPIPSSRRVKPLAKIHDRSKRSGKRTAS